MKAIVLSRIKDVGGRPQFTSRKVQEIPVGMYDIMWFDIGKKRIGFEFKGLQKIYDDSIASLDLEECEFCEKSFKNGRMRAYHKVKLHQKYCKKRLKK